jgi:hypothetical protein
MSYSDGRKIRRRRRKFNGLQPKMSHEGFPFPFPTLPPFRESFERDKTLNIRVLKKTFAKYKEGQHVRKKKSSRCSLPAGREAAQRLTFQNAKPAVPFGGNTGSSFPRFPTVSIPASTR